MAERLPLKSILPKSLVNFPSFFPELGKTEKSRQEQHFKIQKLHCELGKTWKYNQRLTLKIGKS